MKKFFNKSWWQDALSATFGTIVGILLTFGVTYWMQYKEQVHMTRKITKITLRNLDIRIGFMQQEIEQLKAQDAIFRKVQACYPDRLHALDKDTLLLFLASLEESSYNMTDRKSETIFSHSFEVWKYLDDEKIIGRISNCYSIIDFHNELLSNLHRTLFTARQTECEKRSSQTPQDAETLVKALLSRMDIQLTLERVPQLISMLESMQAVASRLNERNKQVMNLSEEELNEVGNLLEQNQYEITHRED